MSVTPFRFRFISHQFAKEAAAKFFWDRFHSLQRAYSQYLNALILKNLIDGTLKLPNARRMLLISGVCFGKKRGNGGLSLFGVRCCGQIVCILSNILFVSKGDRGQSQRPKQHRSSAKSDGISVCKIRAFQEGIPRITACTPSRNVSLSLCSTAHSKQHRMLQSNGA